MKNLPTFDSYVEAVEYHAAQNAEAPAVHFGGATFTYGELLDRVDLMARSLVGVGVEPGDRVACLSTPRPEFWTAFLAIMRIGAVYVGLNPAYSRRELIHVVSDCEASLLLGLGSTLGQERDDDVDHLLQQVDSLVRAFRLDAGEASDSLRSNLELLDLASDVDDELYRSRIEAVTPTDPAAIVYTSGSSGTPKGALLPSFGLAAAARSGASLLNLDPPRVPCNLPTNHTGCLVDVCGATLMAGGAIAFMESFDPEQMLEQIESLRLNALLHVPTVLQLLASHPDFENRDLSSIELVSWGGAPMPVDAVRFYRSKGYRLVTVYGMTEIMGNVTYTRADADDVTLATTVGKPNDEAEVKLVDEDDREVGVEEEGEILYRHRAMMIGYFGNDEATAAAFTDDGFYRTGDVGVLQADGNLRLVGRRSEMFKSGGLNVYPREVELVIESMPGVTQAAVVSMPDDVYSEVGHAVVVADGEVDVSTIRVWCRDQLAGYKVPKTYELRAELPLLAIGKVDKQLLANQWSARAWR